MKNFKKYALTLLLGLTAGVICGLCGTLFSKTVGFVTALRQSNGWLLWLLPIGGLLTVLVYKLCKVKNTGTTNVFDCARENKDLPNGLPVAIFLTTAISHLFGASAGREGAALQIGGGVANILGKAFKLDEDSKRITVMCGMAALFSAVFGTPLAACVFVLEVVFSSLSLYAVIPVLIASFSAFAVSRFFGVSPERFELGALPKFSLTLVLKTALITAAGILVAFIFCQSLIRGKTLFKKAVKNEYLRIALGGIIIIALTFLVGNRDYNGGGIDVIERVFEGSVKYEAFALKILFTAICISAGYKGGEIIPTLFIGATFGGALAQLLALPMGFGAAVGMAVLFCAATKCPVATVLLCCEMLGFSCAPFVIPTVIISFISARYPGLYSNSMDIIKYTLQKHKAKKLQTE